MTVEKFVDKLIEIDKIESKYEYAKAYMKLVLPKAMWAMKNYKAIEKEKVLSEKRERIYDMMLEKYSETDDIKLKK